MFKLVAYWFNGDGYWKPGAYDFITFGGRFVLVDFVTHVLLWIELVNLNFFLLLRVAKEKLTVFKLLFFTITINYIYNTTYNGFSMAQ